MKKEVKLYVVVSNDSNGGKVLVETAAHVNRANAENVANQLNAPDKGRLDNAYSAIKFWGWKAQFSRKRKANADISFNAEWVMQHFADLDKQKVEDTIYKFGETQDLEKKYTVEELVITD